VALGPYPTKSLADAALGEDGRSQVRLASVSAAPRNPSDANRTAFLRSVECDVAVIG
jgi:hypothetical protein